MLGQLHFNDHTGFQRNVVFWTLAAAAGSGLGFVARTWLIQGHDYTALLALMGLGIGASSGLLHKDHGKLLVGAVLGLALGALAGVVGVSGALGAYGPLLGVALAGVGVGLTWGPSEAPRPARAVGFSLMAVVGLFVSTKLFLTTSPIFALFATPGVQDVATGATMGFFLSLGSAVGRLRLDTDPVNQLWAKHRGEISGDLKELAGQSVNLYGEIVARIKKRLDADTKNSQVLNEARLVSSQTTQRLIRLSLRWGEIEKSVDDTALTRLTARRAALQEKVAASRDSVIKAEYGAVVQSIDEQLEGFDKIEVARERLMARMHRCLASLERISLMILRLATSDAQDASLSLRPELDRLDEMSDALSWKGLSVDDLCGPDFEAAQTFEGPVIVTHLQDL